ncbi:hypothetical protein COLO4_25507 [Corchorus olitorius]|uniref:Uncharacterized protein n=1 Tax=Corchorus olitorius TaxID=93759 RepID=A0A1R3I217_9ROSI|nr:hypothetical protein COLO4_25507 [Corchorus olitorius]
MASLFLVGEDDDAALNKFNPMVDMPIKKKTMQSSFCSI